MGAVKRPQLQWKSDNGRPAQPVTRGGVFRESGAEGSIPTGLAKVV